MNELIRIPRGASMVETNKDRKAALSQAIDDLRLKLHNDELTQKEILQVNKDLKEYHAELLTLEFQDYDEFLERGGYVPSGGWCNSCERYDCGGH